MDIEQLLPELPPLPDTEWNLAMTARKYEPEWISYQEGYTDDQMREYAKDYAKLALAQYIGAGVEEMVIDNRCLERGCACASTYDDDVTVLYVSRKGPRNEETNL